MAQWEKDYGTERYGYGVPREDTFDPPDLTVGSVTPLADAPITMDNWYPAGNGPAAHTPLEDAAIDLAVARLNLSLAEKRKKEAQVAFGCASDAAIEAAQVFERALLDATK